MDTKDILFKLTQLKGQFANCENAWWRESMRYKDEHNDKMATWCSGRFEAYMEAKIAAKELITQIESRLQDGE